MSTEKKLPEHTSANRLVILEAEAKVKAREKVPKMVEHRFSTIFVSNRQAKILQLIPKKELMVFPLLRWLVMKILSRKTYLET